MGTTTLLVEIVIIGFQVLIWLSLIIFTTWGYTWVNLSNLKDWTGLIAISFFAVSYTLGIIFDSIVASLLSAWNHRAFYRLPFFINGRMVEMLNATNESYSTPPAIMKSRVRSTDLTTHDYLDKIFNQGRLLRSTGINLLLICITFIIFSVTQIDITWKQIIFVVAILIPLSGLSFWTWVKFLRIYYSELRIAHDLWLSKNPQKKRKSRKKDNG